MKKIKIALILLLTALNCLCTYAQEFEVASFEIAPNDLTARSNSRVDGNGRKCAVIKIYADDQIAAVRGAAIGEVVSTGMEKLIYMSHDSKVVELIFDHHYPLKIVFEDFGYPTITGQMTYVCKLSGNADFRDEKPLSEYSASPKDTTEDVETIYKQAVYYYDEKDYNSALPLFLKASQLGDSKAMCSLGIMYHYGFGVIRDDRKATEWYRKAAELGNPNAQYNLAASYFNGEGVKENKSQAKLWCEKAASQGHKLAKMHLNDF